MTTTPDKEDIPRILIVEDDERLAMLTQDYLRRNGLDVAIETDGTRAIRRIISEQPDLVVLDVMLPGSDGLTVCREVRPHYSHPILMLTARTEDMDQVLGLEMGADDYLPNLPNHECFWHVSVLCFAALKQHQLKSHHNAWSLVIW